MVFPPLGVLRHHDDGDGGEGGCPDPRDLGSALGSHQVRPASNLTPSWLRVESEGSVVAGVVNW